MVWKKKFGTLLIILLPLWVGILFPFGVKTFSFTQNQELLRLSEERGDESGQLLALEGLLEVSPWRGDLWQRVGNYYYSNSRLEEATNAFKQASVLGELDVEGQLLLADALISSRKNEEVFVLLRGIDYSDAEILIRTARLQGAINDTGGTVQTLQKAFILSPQDSEVNYLLGVQLLSRQPEIAASHLVIAEKDNKYREYAAYLRSVYEQYRNLTGSGDWYIFTGQALGRVGEWSAARNSFHAAVEALPTSGTAWALLGEAQQQTGEDGKASLDKALQLEPGGELVNGLLGLYYRRQGNNQLAIERLAIAAAANPGAVVWHIETANTLAAMGDLDKAAEFYEKTVENDRGDYSTWHAYARFCITHNYKLDTLGVNAARQALLLQPQNPVAIDLLGTVYLLLGDLDSAERLFLQAIDLDNDEAAILIHLGQVYLLRGEKDIALAYLRQAADSTGDERLRSIAIDLLRENGAQ